MQSQCRGPCWDSCTPPCTLSQVTAPSPDPAAPTDPFLLALHGSPTAVGIRANAERGIFILMIIYYSILGKRKLKLAHETQDFSSVVA